MFNVSNKAGTGAAKDWERCGIFRKNTHLEHWTGKGVYW